MPIPRLWEVCLFKVRCVLGVMWRLDCGKGERSMWLRPGMGKGVSMGMGKP